MNRVCARFREFRKTIGSQKSLASKIKTSQSVISAVELGNLGISDEIKTKIRNIFHVNLNWLLTGEGEMFLPSPEEQKGEQKVEERPSLDSLVATKDELIETKEELAATNAALKRQLDEQEKRIAALEDLAKSYLPDIASRGYNVAPSSPIAAKGAKR